MTLNLRTIVVALLLLLNACLPSGSSYQENQDPKKDTLTKLSPQTTDLINNTQNPTPNSDSKQNINIPTQNTKAPNPKPSLNLSPVVNSLNPQSPLKLKANSAFVFMDKELICKNDAACYIKHSNVADRVVDSFIKVNVESFLLPPLSLADTYVIADAITQRQKFFFTNERWPFEASIPKYYEKNAPIEEFDCPAYLNTRGIELLTLVRKYPNSFQGLHLKDEPSMAELNNLSRMVACIKTVPELQHLQFYLNLLPLATNWEALSSYKEDRRLLKAQELGFNCSESRLDSPEWLSNHINYYSSYVRSAANIGVNYLATDFYPFSTPLSDCSFAIETLMLHNLAVLNFEAEQHRAEATFNLQNFKHVEYRGEYAQEVDGNALRWILSQSLNYGVKRFTYFVSHSFEETDPKTKNSIYSYGLLDVWNNTTTLYISLHDFVIGLTRPYLNELAGYSLSKRATPSLSAYEGTQTYWFSSQNVNIGVYHSAVSIKPIVVASTRNIGSYQSGVIAFDRWYSIEIFHLPSNSWHWLGTSNYIAPNFSEQGTNILLYRLTP